MRWGKRWEVGEEVKVGSVEIFIYGKFNIWNDVVLMIAESLRLKSRRTATLELEDRQ